MLYWVIKLLHAVHHFICCMLPFTVNALYNTAWQQHDVQELCRVMFDALEINWKKTDQANLINELYQGKLKDYVRCLEVSEGIKVLTFWCHIFIINIHVCPWLHVCVCVNCFGVYTYMYTCYRVDVCILCLHIYVCATVCVYPSMFMCGRVTELVYSYHIYGEYLFVVITL